ncbi:uncharacterized protein JCM10292_001653 [Rhodotorula paludigena]|uniref:uncharacterized protein n=1 Tax=Rhodotorula paludigena TaxID=86838 RepID=UPI00317ADF17
MLALKSLHIPHLSASNSRNPSPASSQPATPTLPPASPAASAAPSGTVTPATSARSSPHRSSSPRGRDGAAKDSRPAPPKPERRSTIGASLSALTSSRSASPAANGTAPKSPSLPAGLTITPTPSASPGPPSPAGGAVPARSASDDRSGLRPLRGLSRSTSASGKKRSKSSDRVDDLVPTPAAAAAAQAVKVKKPGLMASFGRGGRGLALGGTQSQPGTSRATAVGVHGAVGGAAGSAGLAGVANSSVKPNASSAAHSGAATPLGGTHAATPGVGGTSGHASVQLHQLADSYVGKVSLRLGEAVNKVFLPPPMGAGGVLDKTAEKAEGAFGGVASTFKGRPAPRLARAKEVGEAITAELQAALHDHYLLRTLLRSSVLKALSLFLTRLSALLLTPTPSDPMLLPAYFAAPRTIKEADALPAALRFNLQVVRCAYEVKHALSAIADPAAGFPHFVEETLKPWRIKLGELIGRAMGAFVQSARLAVGEACARARLEGANGSDGASSAAAAAPAAAGTASALGLNGLTPPVPAAHARTSATSQLRSLSLGRSTAAAAAVSPVPPGVLSDKAAAAANAAASAGPLWLRDLSAYLDAFARVVARLECGTDADKWFVSVATAACWKGMLHLSARAVGPVGLASPAPVEHDFAAEKAVPRRGLLGGAGIKKTPSPPRSPPLAPTELHAAHSALNGLHGAAGPSPSDVAFIRLLSDLELLEARLKAFLVASLSTPATVLAPSPAPTDDCPAVGTEHGCGLCRTARTFDDESSDSSDDEDDGEVERRQAAADPRRESRLALSAMREAMHALSAMVVVVRASKDLGVLRQALEDRPQPAAPQPQGSAPLTPSALFALSEQPPLAAPVAPTHTAVTIVPSSSSLSAQCPTLRSALLTLPPLLLLHLVASRVSPARSFRLPHELWSLRGGWAEYASELRGFAAGEEWEAEVAWEMGGEADRVLAALEVEGTEDAKGAAAGAALRRADRDAIETLKAAVKRASA